MSAWVEDPREPSGWRWDRDAPAGDPTPTEIFNPIAPVPQPGENDALVERTYNGLRADDLDLQQPPQSPAWTP